MVLTSVFSSDWEMNEQVILDITDYPVNTYLP